MNCTNDVGLLLLQAAAFGEGANKGSCLKWKLCLRCFFSNYANSSIAQSPGAIIIIESSLNHQTSCWSAQCAFSLVPGSSFTVQGYTTSSHKHPTDSHRLQEEKVGMSWAFALFDIFWHFLTFSQTKGSLHRAGKLAAAKTPLDSDRRAKVDEQLLVQA